MVATLTAWQDSLESALGELTKFAEAVDGSLEGFPARIPELHSLTELIESFPECARTDPLYALPRLRGENTEVLSNAVNLYRLIFNHFETLAQHLSPDVLADIENAASIIEASSWLGSNAVANSRHW